MINAHFRDQHNKHFSISVFVKCFKRNAQTNAESGQPREILKIMLNIFVNFQKLCVRNVKQLINQIKKNFIIIAFRFLKKSLRNNIKMNEYRKINPKKFLIYNSNLKNTKSKQIPQKIKKKLKNKMIYLLKWTILIDFAYIFKFFGLKFIFNHICIINNF